MATILSDAPPRRLSAHPLARSAVGLLLTALLAVWLTHATLGNAAQGLAGMPLNLITRGVEPFRGLSTGEALLVALQRSVALIAAALGGAVLIGVPAGLAFALSGSRLGRSVAWAIGTAGVALPSFFWAMILQLLVVAIYAQFGATPLPTGGYGLDAHLVLPALALGARPAAYLFRTTATAFQEVRHAEFMRVARAKGLSEQRLLLRHLLPNGAAPVLAGFGLAARSALSSLAIVEYVFIWNGAGFGFIYAVAKGDAAFAGGAAVAFAVLFALVGGLVAVARRTIDPRIEA